MTAADDVTVKARPFWTLVSIRVAFWVGAALALLWAPLRSDFPPFRAYDARSDLLFLTFAQWDSGWFLRIAEHGYDVPATTNFFPLYPLLVRAGGIVLGSSLVAGVLLSLLAAGIAAVLVWMIARHVAGEAVAGDTVLLLAFRPRVHSSVLGRALSRARRRIVLRRDAEPHLAGRPPRRARGSDPLNRARARACPRTHAVSRDRSLRELLRPAPVLLLPAALGLYSLYLERRFDDPFLFTHAGREYWFRDDSVLGPLYGLWESISAAWHGIEELVLDLPRELGQPGGFPEPDRVAIWNVLHLGLLAAALWLTWVAWRRLGPSFGLYALAVDASILAGTHLVFPLVSLPRYLLANFPLFIALASLLRGRPRVREWTLIGFAAVGAVAAVGFSRHAWIG